jgi:3-oxoacyl-(acyl-carrier-protein) synthase
MIGVQVSAAGVVTGWGRGVGALPADPVRAAAGRPVVAATPTPRPGDRLRRATRESLLAIDAVEALLDDGGLPRARIAGDATALVYVTAAAYGASNRAFVEGGASALHFPYTAPSAVPAEVAIEFGLHGPYTVLIGGAATTLDALDHAVTLLARGVCAQALVLGVETFAECADLHARTRWLTPRPLVEAAAAVLLTPSRREAPASVSRKDADAASMACGPLIALAVARARGGGAVAVSGRWRGRTTTLTLGVMAAAGP